MKPQISKKVKGFTLIELLVVIAIVAILFAAVVVTLNPAELLRQSRDSNRISDLATIKSAISLYLVDVSNPTLGSTTTCYVHAGSGITSTNCGNRFSNTTANSSISSRAVDGTGWIPVKFTEILSGSPISILPVDPINDGTSTYYYAYAPGNNLTFEINANMESVKYSKGGKSDVESNDGGNDDNIYEVGTDPGLDL